MFIERTQHSSVLNLGHGAPGGPERCGLPLRETWRCSQGARALVRVSLPSSALSLRTGGFPISAAGRARALRGDMQPVSPGPVVGLITAISD